MPLLGIYPTKGGIALIPTYASAGSAGADLFYTGPTRILYPGAWYLFETGTAVSTFLGSSGLYVDDYAILIVSRSGLAYDHGVTVLNSPGLVDPDYKGEIKVNLINLGRNAVEIKDGDRIAQAMIVPFERNYNLPVRDTIRGEGGHGSTGR